jgi:hypothetical protein
MKLNKIAAFVLTLMAAGSVYAQSPAMTATIPFNFVFRGQTMPAGDYTIIENRSTRTIAIQQAEVKTPIVAMPVTVEAVAQHRSSGLVFHRYGDRYFLSEVWGNYHSAFAPSKVERELAVKRSDPGTTVLQAAR